MENVYVITLKQQLSLLASALIKYGILITAYLYFFGFNSPTSIFVYVFLFLFLFDLLPAVILHVQYFIRDRNTVFRINVSDRCISYNSKKLNFEYSFSEIHSIGYVTSYGYRGSKGWYSFGEYRYCKIAFKDSTSVIITCLMINDIGNTLETLLRVKLENKLRVVALIY